MKSISPIHFIDKLVKKNELGQSFTLIDHQREILRFAFAFDEDGRLPTTRSFTAAARNQARPRSTVL
jgi:hypothetical protein